MPMEIRVMPPKIKPKTTHIFLPHISARALVGISKSN